MSRREVEREKRDPPGSIKGKSDSHNFKVRDDRDDINLGSKLFINQNGRTLSAGRRGNNKVGIKSPFNSSEQCIAIWKQPVKLVKVSILGQFLNANDIPRILVQFRQKIMKVSIREDSNVIGVNGKIKVLFNTPIVCFLITQTSGAAECPVGDHPCRSSLNLFL